MKGATLAVDVGYDTIIFWLLPSDLQAEIGPPETVRDLGLAAGTRNEVAKKIADRAALAHATHPAVRVVIDAGTYTWALVADVTRRLQAAGIRNGEGTAVEEPRRRIR